MKKLLYYFVLLITCFSNAQTAELDLTFNNNSALSGNGEGPNKYLGFVSSSAIQNDGKTIIAGDFTSYNGTPCKGLLRLNADGSIDNSFAIIDLTYSSINAINIQPDGKIIIAGSIYYLNANIVRLNADGSIDTTFSANKSIDGEIMSSIIQPDGKIIIGGTFTKYNNVNAYRIARLNADGTIDTNFNKDGLGAQYGVSAYNNVTNVKNIKLQADGKIIVIGNFTAFNSTVRNHIARLNSDGSIDLSFNSEIGFGFEGSSYISTNSISIQNDGKIIVGGEFISYNNTHAKGLVRINSDGSIDNTFNVGDGFTLTGKTISGKDYTYPGPVIATEIQTDGKIIVAGNFTKINQTLIRNLARLNSDGSLDLTFNNVSGPSNITLPHYENNTLGKISTLILTNQNIYIGGSFDYYNYTNVGSFTKLNSNGSIDFEFNKNNAANETVKCTQIQSDGKIIIGGNFTRYNGTDKKHIVRINQDGSIDESFNIGNGAVNTTNFKMISSINSIVIQPDHKIIAAGDFNYFNNVAKNQIVRLNADGSIDNTFDPILPSISSINKIILQPDGKIIARSNEYLFRLNSNGSNDNSFKHIEVNSYYVSQNTVALKNDGKIIYSSESQFGGSIMGLNADGSIDTNFNTVSVSGIMSLEIQSDGKIIIAGGFNSINNVNAKAIARLNANGTLDVTFYSNTYMTGRIITTKTLNNGQILIGCYGTDSVSNNSLLLLNGNGSLDTNFNIGTGFAGGLVYESGSVYDFNIQADNKILVSGAFTTYNDILQNRILRLNNLGTLSNEVFKSANEISLYPNPTKGLLNIEIPAYFEFHSINIFNQLGQKVLNQNDIIKTIDVSTLSAGTYFMKIKGTKETITKKFIKN